MEGIVTIEALRHQAPQRPSHERGLISRDLGLDNVVKNGVQGKPIVLEVGTLAPMIVFDPKISLVLVQLQPFAGVRRHVRIVAFERAIVLEIGVTLGSIHVQGKIESALAHRAAQLFETPSHLCRGLVGPWNIERLAVAAELEANLASIGRDVAEQELRCPVVTRRLEAERAPIGDRLTQELARIGGFHIFKRRRSFHGRNVLLKL